MDANKPENAVENLPRTAREYIKLIIKKMRYRKSVRREVQQELVDHFEDELRDCADEKQREEKAQSLIENFGDAKLLGILLRRAKKRCRPLWRTIIARTFQTIGVLILSLILYCIYISMGQPTVKVDYIEEMTELVRPNADESLNAANLYNQAIALYKEPPEIETEYKLNISSQDFGPTPPVFPRDVNIRLNNTQSTLITTNLLQAIKDRSRIDELAEIELAKLKGWIQDNSEAIDLYIQGSKRPYCWWHRESDANNVYELLLPELRPMRDISKLIRWRTRLKADRGDIDGAFQDIFAMYRVGEHFKGPRTLVEQLVGVAIQTMAVQTGFQIIDSTEPGERMLTNIQNEFQLLVKKATFNADFTVEKFRLLDFIQRSYTDDGGDSGRMTPIGLQKYYGQPESFLGFENYWEALGVSLISANREEMRKMTEGIYNTMGKVSKLTPRQRNNINISFDFNIQKWSTIKQFKYWPIFYLTPAFQPASKIPYQLKAESQALITVIALKRYKQQNGVYPDSLDTLVDTNLLTEIPVDPFSNTILIYRKTDEDFILYSYGLNLKDDGGVIGTNSTGEKIIWADEGDAVFWPVQK